MTRNKTMDKYFLSDAKIIKNIQAELPINSVKTRTFYLNNIDKEQDIRLKLFTCRLILGIFAIWLLFIMSLLFIIGAEQNWQFSDQIIITLLATTTANLIGLPLVITKSLFKS